MAGERIRVLTPENADVKIAAALAAGVGPKGLSFGTDPDGASVLILTDASGISFGTDPDGIPVIRIEAI